MEALDMEFDRKVMGVVVVDIGNMAAGKDISWMQMDMVQEVGMDSMEGDMELADAVGMGHLLGCFAECLLLWTWG